MKYSTMNYSTLRYNIMKYRMLALSAAVAVSAAAISGCGGSDVQAQAPVFTLSSPDLASGTFANKFILNGFGCTGQNISPELQWSNIPAGTQSLALQVFDPDAPSGSGFWHWAVYDIPPTTTGLAQGAGNSQATLPVGAFGGTTDLFDTGLIGGNGHYGGPCPPVGDTPHRYIFTLYAVGATQLEVAAGVPKTGAAGLYGFALNKGIGTTLLGKATFTAFFGR
jgi:Raf kinase inhibitor-like YbhB/YbcL family protein